MVLFLLLLIGLLTVSAKAGAELNSPIEKKNSITFKPTIEGLMISKNSLKEGLSKNSMITTTPELQEEKTYYSDTIQVLVTERIRKRIDEKLLDFDKEIEMLAQVVYKEARGIVGTHHKAAVIWCVLNRLDSGIYGNSLYDIIVQPNAFAWSPNTRIEEEFVELATDVMTRWLFEHEGYVEVGRVLPKEYIYFHGADGVNKFKKQNNSRVYWDWSLKTPYTD